MATLMAGCGLLARLSPRDSGLRRPVRRAPLPLSLSTARDRLSTRHTCAPPLGTTLTHTHRAHNTRRPLACRQQSGRERALCAARALVAHHARLRLAALRRTCDGQRRTFTGRHSRATDPPTGLCHLLPFPFTLFLARDWRIESTIEHAREGQPQAAKIWLQMSALWHE